MEKLELVLNRSEDRRFAPSSAVTPTLSVDEEFQKELEAIPDKMAFKIGEVAKLVGVKAYVLRYWEAEFETLSPKKSKHGQRAYTKKDVELVFMIKKLLYKDRYSIEGARTALRDLKKATKKDKAIRGMAVQLEEVRDQAQDLIMELERIKKLFQ